ncbi:MAG TPA: NAD(P)H-hydrate epimerase [Thermomicrobiales bacterium]|nr:NAD(P)H-hydrate epimerase [Thermomicrobiales bacterium]
MHHNVPAVTGAAMARIDRIMIQEMGVDMLQLMEIAGFAVADVARRHCGLDLTQQPAIVALAGTGGNGGDAMVAARLLHAWGARATVVLLKPRQEFSGIAAHQLAILDRMGIPVQEPGDNDPPPAEVIIDGLFGFSLQGNPRDEAARLITLANAQPAPVLAIDVPSGLDATSGEVSDPCIRARWTVTLALPKTGLIVAPADITGAIWLADIGVPPDIYARIGVDVPGDLFANRGIIPIL